MTDVKSVLEGVREKVSATHWVKGAYYKMKNLGRTNAKPCGCLIGLVRAELAGCSMPNNTVSYNTRGLAELNVRRTLMDAIRQVDPGTTAEEVEAWNDRDSTTRERVLEVLDRAIASS